MFNLDVNPKLFELINWNSDWKGFEVGFPEVEEVGFYSYCKLYMLINMETLQILEAWFDEEEQ